MLANVAHQPLEEIFSQLDLTLESGEEVNCSVSPCYILDVIQILFARDLLLSSTI